jgi:Holliday junction resolvasome RuvABC endonuclease subunit
MKTVVGIDPGFAALGYAEVELLDGGGYRPLRVGVIRTTKDANTKMGKTKVPVMDDEFRRLREITKQLDTLLEDAVVVTAEEPNIFNCSNITLRQVSQAWGAVVAKAAWAGFIRYTPKQMREALGLKLKASKKDMEECLQKKYGPDTLQALWTEALPDRFKNHGYDALATIDVAIRTGDLRRKLEEKGIHW